MNEYEWSVWVKLYIHFIFLVIHRLPLPGHDNQSDLYSRKKIFKSFLQIMLTYIDINNKTGMFHIHISHYQLTIKGFISLIYEIGKHDFPLKLN